MADDQKIRLALEILGEEGVEALRAALDATNTEAADLAAALGRGEISAAEYDAEMKRVASSAKGLADALRGLDAAAAARDAEVLADADRKLAESLEQAARAASDAAAADATLIAQAAELARANAAVAAACTQVNAALAREATEAEEAAAALGREMNALYAADGAMEGLADSTNRGAEATRKASAATGDATSKNLLFQQSVQASSYAFQDFASNQGDFWSKMNGISNNIPGILAPLAAMGPYGQAAVAGLSTVFTITVAIGKNWDAIKRAWEGTTPFPKAAGDVAGLKRELEAAKDAMEKLEKAGAGTVAEVARYNTLRERTATLEKEIADQTERQARLKRFLASQTDEEEGRGKAYTEATKGRGGEYLDRIQEALRKDGEQQIANERMAMNKRLEIFSTQDHSLDEQDAFMTDQANRFNAFTRSVRANDWGERAKELNDRLLQGEGRAGTILERLMNDTGVFFDGLGDRMKAANPQLKKQQADLVEALTKQGEEGEKAALAEVAALKAASDQKVKVVLDTLKQQGGVATLAADLEAEAKRKGLDVVATFEFVKKGLEETITAHLADLKIKPGAGGAAQVEAVAVAAAGGERKAAIKEEAKEAKAEDKATAAEARKITDTLGKVRQSEYEALVAGSAAARAGGGPVARTKAQERQFQAAGGVAGRDYGLPAGVLERRLQAQMAQEFRRKGVGEPAANLAAKGIADKGNQDLERRAAAIAGQNLGVAASTLQLTRELVGEYQKLSGMQRQLQAQAQEQQRAVRATRVSNQKTVR